MTMIPKFGTSFLLAMLSVAGTLVGKGLILAVLMFKYCGPCSQALGSDLRIPSIAVWVGVFLVPHLILVSIGTFNFIAMSLDFDFCVLSACLSVCLPVAPSGFVLCRLVQFSLV